MSKKYPIIPDMQLWEDYKKNKIITQNIALVKEKQEEYYPQILDLHGYDLDSGYRLLKIFIMMNYNRGVKSVSIITGKGKWFMVKVPRWLEEHEFKDYVASWQEASIEKGGKGRLIVNLKK